jgi:hypothetical protein
LMNFLRCNIYLSFIINNDCSTIIMLIKVMLCEFNLGANLKVRF